MAEPQEGRHRLLEPLAGVPLPSQESVPRSLAAPLAGLLAPAVGVVAEAAEVVAAARVAAGQSLLAITW